MSVWTGLEWLNTAVGLLAIAGLLITVANFAYVAACHLYFRPHGTPAAPDIADAGLPHVLLQIPIYNEAAVAEQAAVAAVALDWPRDRLHVQILDDSTDHTPAIVATAVGRLRAAGHDIVHVRRDNRVGFKAGALSAGLAISDAPFVAMLDADFRAPASWLRGAVAVLEHDPRAAFAQQRCDFRSREDNALTRVQQLMQDAHYMVEQAARHGRGVPMPANGTATVWRRAAIDDAGGWSGDTLTEDLDLTLRVYLRSWHAALLLEPPCVGEMPARLDDWRTQQSRWSSGFLQVTRKLLPALWHSDLGVEAKLATSLLLLVQLFFPSIVLLGVTILIGAALQGGFAQYREPAVIGAGLGIALLLAMTLPPYLALRRGSIARYAVTLIKLPFFMIHLGLANAVEILTAALGRQRAFAVTPKQGH